MAFVGSGSCLFPEQRLLEAVAAGVENGDDDKDERGHSECLPDIVAGRIGVEVIQACRDEHGNGDEDKDAYRAEHNLPGLV